MKTPRTKTSRLDSLAVANGKTGDSTQPQPQNVPTTPSSSKLDMLKTIDGKRTTNEADLDHIRKLESILDINRTNQFGTQSLAVFKQKLEEMTTTELEYLCNKVALVPSGSRADIKAKLIKEFIATVKNSLAVIPQAQQIVLDPKNPKHKLVLDMMKEF